MEIDLVEKKAVVNSIEIKYMFKPATLDTDHLIIIFSGYGLNSLFTYDWSGDSQKDIPSNILWIKDEFDECPCYYLCKHRNFIIEDSIIKFIKQWLHTLSLTNDDVTLLGASKGATSALYYGIKYGFKNIISSAPQLDLGNFLERIHKVVTRNYMYDLSKNDNIEFFNRIIYKIINENNFVESNIYLIYSDIDEYQESYSEIIDILKNKCPNFSCIKVDSLLVKYHNQITDYSARLIKSILFQNAFKISPRFDNIIIGSSTIPTISKELCAMQKVHECYYEKIRPVRL